MKNKRFSLRRNNNTLGAPLTTTSESGAINMERLNEDDWKTLFAIADTFAPPVEGKDLAPLIKDPSVDADKLGALCPSKLDGFKQTLLDAFTLAPSASQNQLILTMKLLGQRPVAGVITGSVGRLFREMPRAEREQVLLSWHYSSLTPFRKLFRSLYSVVCTTFVRINPLLHQAMGHPMAEPRTASRLVPDYDILDFGRYTTAAELDVDVVIVGSGSGAGVVANRLAKDGHSVLILEKGTYYKQSDVKFTENEAYANLYENSGVLQTTDNSMLVLAGATLGGGSTVNWSASLRTPDNVRKQWAEHAPWYDTDVYTEAMDYVMDQMGCSVDSIEQHSFSNQLILDGAKKLNYKAAAIPQNTAGHAHNCGYCGHGCYAAEKQGGLAYWFREPVESGRCRFSHNTNVLRVTKSSKTSASGVEAVVRTDDGKQLKLSVKARQVVVSAGSLQTPVLLQRSGFKNRHIGKGLKLHPVTLVFGEFPETETIPYDKPIMTAVCTEFDNLDSRAHGPKIEAILHQPMLEYGFIPWKSGLQYRQDTLRYNNLAAMLVITRDRGSGKVSFKNDRPLTPSIDYTPSKFDCQALLEGSVGSANLTYIQGATRIITPISSVPIFETDKPVSERSINDPDYQRWLKKLKQATIEPLTVSIGSAHQMASCRMSSLGPKYAPVDDTGRLWECRNLFVADASLFPSASGVNPMISTMATAHVIAGNISKALQKQGGPKL